MQKGRAQREEIEALLYPSNGYRGELLERGVQPRNHMKDYRAKLRTLEQEQRTRREAEEERSKKVPFKLNKYRGIESRVNGQLANTANGFAKDASLTTTSRLPKSA